MANSFSGSGNGANGAGRGTGKVDAAPLADRLPPQNIEAEQSLLGSILLDNEVLHEIIPFLRVEDFYRDAHQLIYAAIRDMYDRNRGIDAVTLAEELTRRDQFEQIGGDETLALITGIVPHSANAQYYAEIVKEKATNRQLIESASEIIREGYSNQFTAQQLLESAERRIFGIAEDQIRGETMELKDIVKQAMDAIAHRADAGGHAVTGIASGLFDLDDVTGGFQPGQLIVLAARPSMGKTALALNICDYVGVNNNVPTLFVSLEMGRIEIADRLLCARCRIDLHNLKTGRNMNMRDLAQLGNAFKELGSGSIFIDDTPARNMLQVAASARRLKRRQRLGLIILDYIQLVQHGRLTRQPAGADRQDQPPAENPGAGRASADHCHLAAQSRRRKPRRQAAQDGRPARIRGHRTGRRPGVTPASPRLLRCQRPTGRGRADRGQESQWSDRADQTYVHQAPDTI